MFPVIPQNTVHDEWREFVLVSVNLLAALWNVQSTQRPFDKILLKPYKEKHQNSKTAATYKC